MIGRRSLLASGLSLPSLANAQTFYAGGTAERPIRFTGAEGASLAGTLLLPRVAELRRVPGVVLIAGSGPTDRDGNNRLVPARIDLLKHIAETLAAAGIGSLRYDKRGIGASTRRPREAFEAQERFFAWPHFVADVQAAHAELLRHDEIKDYATAFIGHSEGGLLAIAACAAMASRRPHALVLAATPGRKLAEIVRAQIGRDGPSSAGAADRILTAIAATGHVPADVPRELQLLFPPHAGSFLRDALAFDPAKTLLALDNACLLLHGAADRQVVALGDIQPLLDAMSRRAAPSEALVVPSVSHNLKRVTGADDPGFSGPLSTALAEKLVDWLGPALGA